MPGRPRTVYVIDDDESVVRALGRLIRSAGMNVVELSGRHDLADLDNLDPDGCIVSDIRMPSGSGLTIPALLAERHTPLPVIFVTAVEDEETRQEAWQVGAVGFFKKPVDDDDLLNAIRATAGSDC